MGDIVIAVLWAATAVLFIYKINTFAHRWLTLTLEAKTPKPIEELPDDLVAWAMQETEKWAQDSALKVARERYDALKDWNRVRAAVGIGDVS